MTFDQIIRDLKNKVYHPVYFLIGDEPYYIDEIADYIEGNVLDEAEKGFNQCVLYGRDADPDTIIENAKRFPMMANHQVVIVKEAQDVKGIEALQPYIENPLDSTILVICCKYKKLDKRKTFTKMLAQKAVLFESKKMYDNKIPDWILKKLQQENYSISPKACVLLSEYLGNDLGKITNELEKLMLNVPEGAEIITEHIEQNIGISKDFNVFELQDAIGKKDALKANRIVNYFGKNTRSHPLVLTMSSLYSYFSKLLQYHFLKDKSQNNVASVLRVHPFFVNGYQHAARNYNIKGVANAIGYLREYDRKSKGMGSTGNVPEGELLKEMIYKILH
ncbi:MAG: DNA polymerase III subunit delta [Flavobacteriales bacterium]|nr:MAG: DNA polymerase III subunit delta [Flavobacteriales bacterium]